MVAHFGNMRHFAGGSTQGATPFSDANAANRRKVDSGSGRLIARPLSGRAGYALLLSLGEIRHN
jgi:hypothetical protein